MINLPHIDRYLQIASEVAKEAGKFLKENFENIKEIEYKGEVNLVTEYDKEAQELIYSKLSSAFPEHGFLGEEDLEKRGDYEFRWIIDPLDGTTNYAHGYPVFCVSIALEHRDRIILGVVYNPMLDELFWAIEGRGAYLNNRKIKVSSTKELDKSLLATGFPYDLRESKNNNINHFNNFILKVQAVRRGGSAALDLCYVACGRLDGFWELKLFPWDIAGGMLIVKEAGGKVSDFRGNEIDPYAKEILASNGFIHSQMIEILKLGEKNE
ncbi:inositol monophosphatase [Candidatus Aminicenantes bacterium AC-335-K20]|nr:inositol monophosphatase [SCandidatus Aminicenantes bacterium Aminicenantia_JdfR_composite]MCP2597215.1 inositol monophosphatase [Candidatus Aminicenantes bacterium AC-335-G13]MCP2598484.1 inositol monophosphatase [Candidatus Aminicenantes bacterium AC-335-L06]MCP2618691.1 inositol monophosphatase [Candidatus Aminicenantes bacterium AC-335-A11]MCP2619524.1 inositol monophosphatase [Candidatus Aminicenantes bacterium AC-335-K20]